MEPTDGIFWFLKFEELMINASWVIRGGIFPSTRASDPPCDPGPAVQLSDEVKHLQTRQPPHVPPTKVR